MKRLKICPILISAIFLIFSVIPTTQPNIPLILIDNKSTSSLHTRFNSNWSNATAISDIYGWNNENSISPAIAVDNNSIVHVVWEDDTNGEWGTDKEIFYANCTTGVWSNATVISDIYGWNNDNSYGVDIAIDNNNNIHVVWADGTDGEWGNNVEIFYANYTAGVWSNATAISNVYGWSNGGSQYPAIAIDSNNNLHVVWEGFSTGEWGNDKEIFYANYTAGVWSNATPISDVYGWNSGGSCSADIAVDNNNNIHVVWQDYTVGEWGNDVEIFYANYTAGIWSNATAISDIYGWNNASSISPSIAVDNNSIVHVVWHDLTDGEWGTDSEIFYVNYTAGVWSNATPISDVYGWNNGNSNSADIAVDNNNNLHVIWKDDTAGEWGTDIEIFYSNYDGSRWSNAVAISAINGWNNASSSYPAIAVDNNYNIHVVWQDDTDGEWGTDQEIFYARGSLIEGQGSPSNNLLNQLILAMISAPSENSSGAWLLIGIASVACIVVIIVVIKRK